MLQWFLRFSEFPEFTDFSESSAPFRENSISIQRLTPCKTWSYMKLMQRKKIVVMDYDSKQVDIPLQQIQAEGQ